MKWWTSDKPMPAIPVEIESYETLVGSKIIDRRPMCMSCGLEVDRAVVIHFAHMCRWADERRHDRVITICGGCLGVAREVLEKPENKLKPQLKSKV